MLFVDQVLEFLINKQIGAIDVNQGKKRWIFYFQDGQLVQTKSNLKNLKNFKEPYKTIKEPLGHP